jgi:hypothetical protein
MSYKATNWAYEMPLRGTSKPVLIALADMADEDSTCYPGQERLSEMTGLSISSVARALKRLETLGLIVREHRYGARGYRTSDRYRLQLSVTLPESLPVTEPTRQSAYQAESLLVTVTPPTGQSDGALRAKALKNHQLEPPAVAAQKRGTRIPDDFTVSPEMVTWARERTPLVDGPRSTEMFVNYWRAATGRNATKLDWQATWRNWMLRDQQSAERAPRRKQTPEERMNATLSLVPDLSEISS